MGRLVGLAAGSLVGLVLLFSAGTAVAGIQDFFVNNNGKFAIYYIYVSPDYSTEWEEDVLGSEVLMPGESLEIEMIGYDNHCTFDIMIEDSQGNQREYWDVDLCTVIDVDFP